MRIIIIIACILTIAAIGIDLYTWSNVLKPTDTDLDTWIIWSRYIRFARTAVFSFIFIAYLQSGHFTKDHTLMLLAMLVATIADFYLILQNKLIIGIGIFAIMQLLLLYRHLHGFSRQLFQQKIYLYFTIGLFIFAAGILYFLYNPLQAKGLFWPVAGYGFLLIISVLAAAYSKASGVLSPLQANLALTGMVLFLICDITVGLGAVWSDQPAGYLVRALTGVVYTPALIFLSLSTYKRFQR
jgi:hypothetical protein